jgi:hypothetical protein
MDKLKELIDVLSNSRTTPKLVAINEIGNGKIIPFFEGLQQDKFRDDDDAAAALYGKTKSYSKYKKLKTHTKRRLVDSLFFLDLEKISSTPRQTAFFECYKDWAAVKILMSSQARKIGLDMCMQVLSKAKKFEFTELAMNVTNYLRVYYGTVARDLKKYEQYDALFKQYRELWDAENVVEELYTDLTVRFVNNKKRSKETPKKSAEYYRRIKPLLEKYDSYRLQLSGHLIRMMTHTSTHDYRRTAKLCEEGIAFFSKKNYHAKTPIQIFYYQKVECHLRLQQYEEGQKAIQACLDMLDEGTYNWFKVQETNLLLATHTGRYQHALEVFKRTTTHKQFKKQPEQEKEMWRIYEAYLYFLGVTNRIKLEPGDPLHKFKLGKFLNETPIYAQDKRGMNIPILIVQILFLIERRQFQQLIKKMDAIKRYSSRYLQKDDTFRSNCMIKMLLEMPDVKYNLKRVERRVQKIYKKLQTVPIEQASHANEVEIIPYEDLWEMALNLLEKKK